MEERAKVGGESQGWRERKREIYRVKEMERKREREK